MSANSRKWYYVTYEINDLGADQLIPEADILQDKRALEAQSVPITRVEWDTYDGQRLVSSSLGYAPGHLTAEAAADWLHSYPSQTSAVNVSIYGYGYEIGIVVEAAGMGFAARRTDSILRRLAGQYPLAQRLEMVTINAA